MNTPSNSSDDDERQDADLARLLRAVGPVEQPDPEVTAQVRDAVAAEWRSVVAGQSFSQSAANFSRRHDVRRFAPLLAVASVAMIAVAAWLSQPLWQAAAGPVATVALVTGSGSVQVRHANAGSWQQLDAARQVSAGDLVRTSPDGRVALRWPDGLEVRVDTGTRLLVAGSGEAQLQSGAVFVDSGKDQPAHGDTFVLDTPAGAVSHLGTQYSVRTDGDAVRVSVREGRVAVERRGDRLIGNAGEQLALQPTGAVVRTPVSPRDPQWEWVQQVTPAFAIEDKALDEFLIWAARQTGRTLVYTSRAAADEAVSIRLQGSVAGLTPDAAVAAVAATTPSLQVRIAGNHIRVGANDQ